MRSTRMSACSQPRSTARVSAASVRADSGRARKDSSTVRGPGTGLVYQPPSARDEAILRTAIDLCLPVALTECVPVGGRGGAVRTARLHQQPGATSIGAVAGATPRPTEAAVSTITTTDGTEIFYKDWGSGQPIVFSHGWPLSADDWDTQLLFFLQHGYRVIAHDRRGHGRSTQTSDGHDMDHYADD